MNGAGVPIITKPRPPCPKTPLFGNPLCLPGKYAKKDLNFSDYYSIIVWKRLLFVFEKVSVGVFVSWDAELFRVLNTNLKGSLHFGQSQPFFCIFIGILTVGCLILAYFSSPEILSFLLRQSHPHHVYCLCLGTSFFQNSLHICTILRAAQWQPLTTRTTQIMTGMQLKRWTLRL